MRYQIQRVSPMQAAKVMAALWFIITLPMILLMSIPMMFMPGPKPPMFGGFMLVMPFLYALFGFLFVLIGAWIYNWVASKLGGIEFDLKETPEV